MSNTAITARMVGSDEGHHVLHPTGANMSIKVFANETGGIYSLMETVLPPGGVVPRHIHKGEDENNFILEGELTMEIGENIYQAGPGSYVVAPRGVEQYFKNNGDTDCRFLTSFTPGGAEGFFKEAGELIRRSAPEKPNPELMAQLQQKYALRYL
ncbi:cupin domain-containing protein [Shimwellia pseudoproteus]|uniref:cupin domain-containing protein n=1 Tax=Shimwellia pseudoproteus TaxID=570012 RepID=UPI0018ECB9CE|nr:cupin domain-containing protein [Shimwellia pseudoproteus]MBJ3816638.1 cupin domain-containing protein [Shimwellia pseudoproteus]